MATRVNICFSVTNTFSHPHLDDNTHYPLTYRKVDIAIKFIAFLDKQNCCHTFVVWLACLVCL